MSSAVSHSGKWRVKPSSKLPIFVRFFINSSFTKKNAQKSEINILLNNRTYLNHMMYWKASEYNRFEKEIIDHMKLNDGWFERYCRRELGRAKKLYSNGLKFKKTNWDKKTNNEIKKILINLIDEYRVICCAWYCQYPLDEFFETTIEKYLAEYISPLDQDFRKYVLVFSDPKEATEVSQERESLLKIARGIIKKKEKINKLSEDTIKKINHHLGKYAYINRGLATSKPYNFNDIINRLKEIKKQVAEGANINDMIYGTSEKKVDDDYKEALKKIKPKQDFLKIIRKARLHSYVRNRRVEAFFNGDFGASFMYAEIAKRSKFDPGQIMEISIDEMIGALDNMPMPSKAEMLRRSKNYAMLVRNSKTTIISDPKKIKLMEKEYFVNVKKTEEIKGRMACLGGIIRGNAKICLNKKEISKVKKGDILVANFTTPDFVPAMEKAVAIVADQGGLSSHAAIVSRELDVPCVIDTKNGTRIIHDNDLIEVNAQTGVVKILKRAK